MNAIKILIIIALVISLARLMRFKTKRTIDLQALLFWSAILIGSVVLFINPAISENIARIIGIGRGVDSMFFLAILLLFYLNFQLYMRIQKLDRMLTTLNQRASEKFHLLEQEKHRGETSDHI